MPRYTVEFTPAVLKQLKRYSPELRERLVAGAEALEGNPHPIGTRKLRNTNDLWRIRVGDYRIV